ncbi:MAG: DUF1800 family protein [Opitutaceae bacterium]|nr:DUF1800 family protein [Opitutaceae bacterium]
MPVLVACALYPIAATAALDRNANQQSDVWELLYSATGLAAALDPDGDGFTNQQESLFGTDPRSAVSRPFLTLTMPDSFNLGLAFPSERGKRYELQRATTLEAASWQPWQNLVGTGAGISLTDSLGGTPRAFYRLQAADADTDGDGLNDWEEYTTGFNPATAYTDRYDSTDLARLTTALSAANTITIAALTPEMHERWPRPGTIAIRRSGGVSPLTIPVTLSGTATRDADYTTPVGTAVTIPAGSREVWIEFTPLSDATAEPAETVQLQLQAGAGYTLGGSPSASITLRDNTNSVTDEEAVRFLIQAGFGADPATIDEVKALGFEAWIDNQFTRPVSLMQPIIVARKNAGLNVYWIHTKPALFAMIMKRKDLAANPQVLPDVLRQRIAYCLLQIFVISQNVDALFDSEGVANYYDKLIAGSFGNFRDLLFEVAQHPVMGVYLSHLGNRKPDPTQNRFADENFAREIMQLFSIGLWELNPDGSRQLDANNQPIPTYTNVHITTSPASSPVSSTAARRTTPSITPARSAAIPMKMWDEQHDLAPKTLLRGVTLPARTASPGSTGTAGYADVNAAIDTLFNHPNVGPFIGRLLIQRLVTSNPSPAYLTRVSAAFADNGAGVRGDLRAVVKAILLDPEARSHAASLSPSFGKKREPYMTLLNYVKTFEGRPANGDWESLAYMYGFYLQEPLQSPSVFNFYSPNYRAPGEITQLGLFSPEFQIMTAVTAIEGANHTLSGVRGDFSTWGAEPAFRVGPDFSSELPLASDPDALIRQIATRLVGTPLNPRTSQIIREAALRIPTTASDWQRERVEMAAYLLYTSAEFQIQR